MISLTQEERKVMLFLISVALVGVGANSLSKRFTVVKKAVCISQGLGKVNINSADTQTLIGLPGIGAKLAQRIIDFRKGQGQFKSVEELRKIKGMSGYRYEKIKDLVINQP